MIIQWYRELFLFLWSHLGFFGGIVGISVLVSLACFPIYNVIGRIVGMENDLQSVLHPAMASINEKYSTAVERQSAIERLYSRFGYHPIMGVRKVLPLFVSIPFLLFTYYMLAGTHELEGARWLCFSDLSKPDGLLRGINLLPFAMTGINILTVYATPCFNKKDELQAWVIALLFLVLLYSANTALMIYWTLNQLFNFLRSLCIDHWAGGKALVLRMKSLGQLLLHPSKIFAKRVSARDVVIMFARSIFGLGVVNLFFLLPLVAILTMHVPPCVSLSIRTDRHITVKVGSGDSFERVKACNADKNIQTVNIFLPCEYDTSSLKVGAEDGAPFELRGLVVKKRFVLAYDYAVNRDGEVFRAERMPGWRLSLPGGGKFLLCFEAFLLLACFAATLAFKKRIPWKSSLWLSLEVSALVILFVVFVLPLQTWLANSALFQFSFASLAASSLLYAIIAILILWCGLFLSEMVFGRFVHTMLIAFVFYEYLNTGILAIGEPTLNGELSYYLNSNLMMRDTIVIGVVFGGFAVCYRWIANRLHWFALCLSVLMAVLLVGVRKDVSGGGASFLSPGFCSKRDAVVNAEHSGKRNVMVIILDAIGTKVARDVLAEDPSLKGIFSGFTAYDNNIGVHNKTETSTAATMSGEMFDPQGPLSPAEYRGLPTTEKSLVSAFVKDGISASVVWGSILQGYSSSCVKLAETQAQQEYESPFFYRPETIPALSLFETIRFRLAPFRAKHELLLMTFIGMRSYASIVDESSLFPILAKAGINQNLDNNFETFHTNGAHSPFDLDKHGNSVASTWGWQGHYDKAYYVLHETAKLMRAYQKRGIYDNSFIIIMADHGWFDQSMSSDPKLKMDRAKPMLWVKPIGATGELASSDLPTWHLKLKNLILAAKDKDMSKDEVERILRSSDRRFRRIDGYEYDDIVDYLFDDEGNVVGEKRLR